MPERISVTVPERGPESVSDSTRRTVGRGALETSDVFQIPVRPTEGEAGELVLSSLENGEEVYRGSEQDEADEATAAEVAT